LRRPPFANPTVWFTNRRTQECGWDGSSARVLNRTITNTRVPSGGNVLVSSATPRCFLSADGAHLFWFENRFKTVQTPDMGQDISVNTTFHGWQTDLSGQHQEDILTYTFPPCVCETAVCSETCAEASYSLPDAGIDDHFIVTNWIPGQIQSEYQASFLYRKSARGWTQMRLLSAVEQALDSSWDGDGLRLIEAIADGGCCGWVNASDDQTLLTKSGKSLVLFDEFRRYQNQDYDVSFFTSRAKLSPHSMLAALTITATSEPGTQIRLSDSGKSNVAELARIQQALRELPAVEVLRLDDPPKRTDMIPHARLVGWLNDEEILVVENNFLVSCNVMSGRRRKSAIKVARESHAFLR